jgi:hypothetical protein
VSISPTTSTVTLNPSYAIPIALIVVALPLLIFVNLWAGGVVLAFGCFLLFQAATLRLVFTSTDLDIYRGETRIRQFPYQEWQIWDIFWSPVPILFYFRETQSIHFLPILFDADELRSQLEYRVPNRTDS